MAEEMGPYASLIQFCFEHLDILKYNRETINIALVYESRLYELGEK